MISSTISMAELKCPPLVKIDLTRTGWTEFDNKTIKRATYVCSTRYAPRGNPCLIKFIKKGFQEYLAICGRKR